MDTFADPQEPFPPINWKEILDIIEREQREMLLTAGEPPPPEEKEPFEIIG